MLKHLTSDHMCAFVDILSIIPYLCIRKVPYVLQKHYIKINGDYATKCVKSTPLKPYVDL